MKKTLLALMIMSTTFSPMVWAEQSTTQSSQQQVKPTNSTAQQKPKLTNNTQQQKVNTTAQTKPTANTQQAKPTAQQQVKPRTNTPQQKPTVTQVKPTVNTSQQARPTTPVTAQPKPTPPVQLAQPVNNQPQKKPTTTAVVATTAAAATAATVVAAAQSSTTSSEQVTPTESTTTTQAPLYNPAMAVVPNVAGATKSDVNKATTDAKVDKTKLSATQVVVSKEVYERYQSLEQRNDETVAQNQELQMNNDNLSTQVKVLESERTAQLLFYGAMILLMGAIFGFLTGYLFARRQRPYL